MGRILLVLAALVLLLILAVSVYFGLSEPATPTHRIEKNVTLPTLEG